MNDIASRYSFLELDGTNELEVASGAPVTVYGILFDNPSGGAAVFNVRDAAGNEFARINLATLSSFTFEISFKADAGIEILSDTATTFATVFHNNPGL